MNINKLLKRAMNFKSKKYCVSLEYTSGLEAITLNIHEKTYDEKTQLNSYENVVMKSHYIGENYGASLEEMWELIGAYETKMG